MEWIGYELHPETPPEGKPLRQLLPGYDPDKMTEGMNRAGAPYGIKFNPIEIVANSRLALEAGEFARDAGKFEEAHIRLFHAYFQEGENIGEKGTLLRLLGEIGLDKRSLSNALDYHVYSSRLSQAHEKALEYGITALPTFIINGKEKIVGAQRYDVFTRCLKAHVND